MGRKKTAPADAGQKLPTNTFPAYFLRLNDQWRVVVPGDKEDIGHTDFWEQTVARIVADHYRVPEHRLVNLPYCQRRARIVGAKVYYGEKPDLKLLRALREAVGNDQLAFVHDDHEKRLQEDVRQFKKLVLRCAVRSPQ